MNKSFLKSKKNPRLKKKYKKRRRNKIREKFKVSLKTNWTLFMMIKTCKI